MDIVWFVVGWAVLAGGGILCFAVAPYGYEDETGFHLGIRDE